MDNVKARTLKPYEKHKIKCMKRQKSNSVNHLHARIILLSRGGIEAISWYPYYCARDGPRKFFADIVEQICEVALSPPKRLIGMSVWSLEKLREYLIAQKITASISLEWLRQLLRRCRVRWRHTKNWKDSDDPRFWPKYRRIRRLYGKRPKGGRRICVDEFGPLNLQPRHGKHYARIGHIDRLRATYSRKGGVRYMFGAYDMQRDTLVGLFAAKKNWMSFLAFLKWLRRSYKTGELLHIVLDNAGYHLKEQVLDYAARHKIKFYWTATNASWLNRIESHFTALRKFALDNTDYRSHEQQQEGIERYLSWRNGVRDISLENWKAYRRTQKKAA